MKRPGECAQPLCLALARPSGYLGMASASKGMPRSFSRPCPVRVGLHLGLAGVRAGSGRRVRRSTRNSFTITFMANPFSPFCFLFVEEVDFPVLLLAAVGVAGYGELCVGSAVVLGVELLRFPDSVSQLVSPVAFPRMRRVIIPFEWVSVRVKDSVRSCMTERTF